MAEDTAIQALEYAYNYMMDTLENDTNNKQALLQYDMDVNDNDMESIDMDNYMTTMPSLSELIKNATIIKQFLDTK